MRFSVDRYAVWIQAKALYHRLPAPLGAKRWLLRQTVKLRRLLSPLASAEFPDPLAQLPDLEQAVAALGFPHSPAPELSIVIPCHGQFAYTVQCLASIAAHPPAVPYEVLVVDDATPSEDYAALGTVAGIILLRNTRNLGFIGSCNAAARQARGGHLLFLNNDACVTKGALDELLRTLRLFPQCGVVGSMLLYPNGRLQEAGALLFRDGSAANVGRLDDPSNSPYGFLRSVDYCSGASVMVRTEQFLRLGGFDSHFAPAYYEDADLSMRYRQAGLDTLYQPLSRVVHYEGISNGRFEDSGIKAYQAANQRKFLDRWHQLLDGYPQANAPHADRLPRGMQGRVLLLTNRLPRPDVDAGSICELNLCLLLRAAGFQPTLIPEQSLGYEAGYAELCQGLGIEVVVPPLSGVKSWLRARGATYDLVVLFRPETAHERLALIRRFCSRAKVVYYPHDLHHLRFEREAAVLGKPELLQRAATYRAIEASNTRKADLTVVLSEEEERLLRRDFPSARVATLPLVLGAADGPADPLASGQAGAPAHQLVFIGNFQHSPNRDAVQHFVEVVLPLILADCPDAVFHVVGPNPPPSIQALASDRVIIHGFVEDLDCFLRSMSVAVLPLRYGAGVKGKLGVALRAGLPVVSSSLGVEGVPVLDGQHALIADDPTGFAAAVLRLFADPSLCRHLAGGGQALFAAQWGSAHAYRRLVAMLANLGLEPAPQPAQDPIPLYPIARADWPGAALL